MSVKINELPWYIQRAVDFRQKIFSKAAGKDKDRLWLRATLADVKKAAIINSASRSGSSLLYAVLKKSSQIYSLSGEAVPFYKLNGLSSDSRSSDVIDLQSLSSRGIREDLSRDFLNDLSLGRAGSDSLTDDKLLNDYIDALALRFPLQWPQIRFSYSVFRELALQALRKYSLRHKFFLKEEFYLELIGALRKEYPEVNPHYYDIPPGLIRKHFPQIEIPSGPPNEVLMIEEPPFILLSPQARPAKKDLKDRTLLLKSTVDCYNMAFIRDMLPNARIKIIHLTRNPLGSVNGLYDGWLFRGFFSHNLKELLKTKPAKVKTLAIRGYSDRSAWGKWWWKYDLPAGWQDYARKPLEEVCAFQWRSANKAIMNYARGAGKDEYLRVKYENIISGLVRRRSEIKKIFRFIGLDQKDISGLGLDRLPVIQATKAPGPYRWKKRKDLLTPLLVRPDISRLCGELGYEKGNIGEWL